MLLNINATRGPTGCCSARLLGRGTRSPLHLIEDAASRRGLSRVGYFIRLNGPLNGHPPSITKINSNRDKIAVPNNANPLIKRGVTGSHN